LCHDFRIGAFPFLEKIIQYLQILQLLPGLFKGVYPFVDTTDVSEFFFGLLGVVPEIRGFCFFPQFSYLFFLAVNVKETSLRHRAFCPDP